MMAKLEKTQQTITRLVAKYFNGDDKLLFSEHGWEWQGSQSMNARATLIKNAYGSVANFENICTDNGDFGSIKNQILGENPNIIVSRFDFWKPKVFGCDWFENKQDADYFQRTTKPGFISLAVVGDEIVGAYQLTHNRGDISDFSADKNDTAYAFKAYRAWSFEKPYHLATEMLPKAIKRYEDGDKEAVTVGQGEAQNLLKLHWTQTDIYSSKGEVLTPNDPFQKNPSVYIKAAYGFHPPSWGCVGWNEPGRAKTLKQKTTNPFIMANWVTYTSDDRFAGKLAGFYEVTHEEGLRQNFTAPDHAENFDEKFWKYSLRASRAWEILPEYQPDIKSFYPEMYAANQERSTGRWGAKLPSHLIDKLKALPRREVEVYGQSVIIDSDIVFPEKKNEKGFVGGGAARKRGYEVSEPKETEKELYILKLNGDVSVFLGRNVQDKQIYKVGLSVSPETRRSSLNAALPNGAYHWQIYRTTRQDNDAPYTNFKIAETGEMAMKRYLGVSPGNYTNHLGGEFYLASSSEIEEAWTLGRKTSQDAESKSNG